MAVNRQQLIKLRQNFSTYIFTADRDNMSWCTPTLKENFGAHKLTDCVSGRRIFYAQLIKSKLLKFCFLNRINIDFVFDDAKLLEESENFYEFLYLASKDQIKKTQFHSKALRIFPLCIIPYAQYLPKNLDLDLIEEIIDRFPVLYSFISKNFEIPQCITNKFIKNKKYFYDGKLLKLMVEQKPGQVEDDYEVFFEHEYSSGLTEYSESIAGNFVEDLDIKITQENFYLFNWSKCRGNELHQIIKYGNVDNFLDHIGEYYLVHYGRYSNFSEYSKIDCETLEDLVDVIKQSKKSSIDKHKMFILLLMAAEYTIFNIIFSDMCWEIKYYGYHRNVVEFRNRIEEYRLHFLESSKIAQLYSNYPRLCKNLESDILENLNPFLCASYYSRQRDQGYRYLYMEQKRAFTRILKAHNEMENDECAIICKKFLRKFQPNFYCRYLYGSARKN